MKLNPEKRIYQVPGRADETVVYDVMFAPNVDFDNSEPFRPILVLVNGFGRNRLDFRAFRRRVHSECPELVTVALDNRGAGESVTRSSFTITEMARDVLSIAHLVCDEFRNPQFHLLGISMGGMIAQQVAASTSQVQRLVLVSTTPGGSLRVWPPELAKEMEDSRDSATGHVSLPSFKSMPKDLDGMRARMQRFFGSKFVKSAPILMEAMAKTVLNSGEVEGAEDMSRLQYNASIGFDGTSLLNDIRCPVLVVTGDEDAVIPSRNSEALVKNLRHAELLVYPEVGHLILIEEPELFANDVLKFLRGIQ